MPFWKLYYHIVWSTKGRQPMITSDIEDQVHQAMRRKAKALGGEVFEVNGTEDHVHMGASIPPSVSISRFVGEVKGATTHHINHLPDGDRGFEWQRGYGVVSFRYDNLQVVTDYIRGQKEHHASGKLWPTLEDCSEDDDRKPSRVCEERAIYDPFGPDVKASG